MTRRPRIPGTTSKPRTLYILPAIDDTLDAEAKNALAIRNACAVDGRCPCCGAVGEVHPDANHALLFHYVFAHEDWCAVLRDAA